MGACVLLFVVVLCATTMTTRLVGCQATVEAAAFPHHVILGGGDFIMEWRHDQHTITFKMSARTSGWVGLGVSPNGGMKGADMAVGWVDEDQGNEVYVLDTHSTRNGAPRLDTEDNLHLLSGMLRDGWTTVVFSRDLDTCDSDHDLPITENTMKIIWAFGPNKPRKSDISFGGYHRGNRGSRSLILINNLGAAPLQDGSSPNPTPTTSSSAEKRHDFLNSNFSVVADTYYNCKQFKMPKLGKKHHVIRVKPVVQEGNERHVHHILMYACIAPLKSYPLGEEHECMDYNMPEDYGKCMKIINAWAIGGSELVLPDHVGLPIGDVDSPTFVLMETHYDNPLLEKINDSSGLGIVYTEELREHDADMLTVGHAVTELQIVPPRQNEFRVYGDCPHQCLDMGMESQSVEEINVIGTVLHSHLLGKSMELKHIRNGVELEPISSDESYDFNYQEFRKRATEIKVKRGDDLKMICRYDSRSRSYTTHGGLGTYQEMCLAFLLYYPKIGVSRCESEPAVPTFVNYFNIDFRPQRFAFLNPYSHQVMLDNGTAVPLPQYFESIQWNSEMGKELSRMNDDTMVDYFCMDSTFRDLAPIKDSPSIQVKEAYVKRSSCSKQAPPPGGDPDDGDGEGGGAVTSSTLLLLALALLHLVVAF